jgi:hypothetical protein
MLRLYKCPKRTHMSRLYPSVCPPVSFLTLIKDFDEIWCAGESIPNVSGQIFSHFPSITLRQF